MSLSNAVQGARHTAQQINWVDGDGDPLNLTGATITARLLDLATSTARAVTGTLAVLDAEAGLFSWVHGVDDAATAGAVYVPVGATARGAHDNTLAGVWGM